MVNGLSSDDHLYISDQLHQTVAGRNHRACQLNECCHHRPRLSVEPDEREHNLPPCRHCDVSTVSEYLLTTYMPHCHQELSVSPGTTAQDQNTSLLCRR